MIQRQRSEANLMASLKISNSQLFSGAFALVLIGLALPAAAHDIQFVTETEGAKVSINGAEVGETPLTWKDTSGSEETIAVEVSQGGQTKAFTINRSAMNAMNIGIGAGVGAGACCLIWAGGGIASFVVPFVGCISTPVGCLALLGGPAVAYMMFGKQGPDIVNINLGSGEVTSTPPGMIQGEGPVPEGDAAETGGDDPAPKTEGSEADKPATGSEGKAKPADADKVPVEEDVQPY
jgi:hypothetical protein